MSVSDVLLFDTHSHFDVAAFDDDRDAALARAKSAGVEWQLLPAIDRAGWQHLADVCDAYPGLLPAYGLHPVYLPTHREDDLQALPEWIERHATYAIGEIGLDFFLPDLDVDLQTHYFETQLRIARDHHLPVILHARRAVDAVLQTLRRIKPPGGIVHSFAGSEQQARQLIDMGFVLGIGGPVTYERAQRMHRVLKTLPRDGFVLETDSPDQPDSAWQGRRNEPARLVTVLAHVARIRDEAPEDIARYTTDTACKLFGISRAS
ncbi:TatD family hydrolase [Lysobacter soyae]|uniref:TatD family hydrolase n=1 Tax=Lysobacter soyae TaxID=2764185 RepID=UPI002102C550|nr:TatD family hydrolase [Lysobacter sp. CJ11]